MPKDTGNAIQNHIRQDDSPLVYIHK